MSAWMLNLSFSSRSCSLHSSSSAWQCKSNSAEGVPDLQFLMRCTSICAIRLCTLSSLSLIKLKCLLISAHLLLFSASLLDDMLHGKPAATNSYSQVKVTTARIRAINGNNNLRVSITTKKRTAYTTQRPKCNTALINL